MTAARRAQAPVVDVVVVTYCNAATISECLSAASSIDGIGRVIVVDHGDDESSAAATRAGACVFKDPTNPGFGAGQNRGIAEGVAPYVLVLNPDAIPKPPAIETGVRYLDQHPEVAIVQGVIRDSKTGDPDRSQGRELGVLHLWGRAVGARRLRRLAPARWLAVRLAPLRDHVERAPTEATRVDVLAATAWLARREALTAVGGFDERYFLYGEDLDLSRRLRASGWSLVALPDEWAVHAQGASAASRFERELTWWAGTMQYTAQWWSLPRRLGALVAAAVRAFGLVIQQPGSARRVWRSTVGRARRARPSAC